MKAKRKQLQLNRETIRLLNSRDLMQIHGGKSRPCPDSGDHDPNTDTGDCFEGIGVNTDTCSIPCPG